MYFLRELDVVIYDWIISISHIIGFNWLSVSLLLCVTVWNFCVSYSPITIFMLVVLVISRFIEIYKRTVLKIIYTFHLCLATAYCIIQLQVKFVSLTFACLSKLCGLSANARTNELVYLYQQVRVVAVLGWKQREGVIVCLSSFLLCLLSIVCMFVSYFTCFRFSWFFSLSLS